MRSFLSFAVIATFCLSAAPARAAPEIPEDVRQRCKADYAKLCNGVMPGGGRIVACFQSHKDEISPDCRDALAKMKK